ncbi:hypothetical protein LTR62_001487 [Meristemomyces frigidus]|uniref:Uncharacterized protein n=1 Tax=Meristemomyces frigidus TaxID=1508187 RepID=A0AAN7TLJ9_9PEZI|nr:hypothetical protein LTR62_001487 [Meristemomyces frigidus]
MSYAADSRANEARSEGLNNPKNENPGIVTSDSLAAESIQGGGSFGANSDSRGPMDQPSKGSNAANTDTSGATTLESARSAGARDDGDGEQGYGATGSGQTGTQYEQAGGLGSSASGGVTYTDKSSSGNGSSGNSGSNNSRQSGGSSSANSRPKGQNVQEGGFDSDAPNASFTTDIGGQNDPGRAALNDMQARTEPGSGGTGAKQYGVTNDGQFDSLGESSA